MKDNVLGQSAADLLLDTPADQISYRDADRSFSPFYSNIGLTFDKNAGVASIELHFNRRTQSLRSAVTLDGAGGLEAGIASVRSGDLQATFFGRDAFVLSGKRDFTLNFLADPKFRVISDDTGEFRVIHALLSTLDPRDPDVEVPILLALRLQSGAWDGNTIRGQAPSVACTIQLIAIDVEQAKNALSDPVTTESANEATKGWVRQAVGNLRLFPKSPHERSVLSRSVQALLMNSVEAPGLLAGRISSYPSRGGYPTHFLWDSCFHMLALEEMDDRLCRDALMILTDNVRPDGKIAHFVCSTWIRPKGSQPALVGWAAERYFQRTGDQEFVESVLPALEANCHWWLTHRLNSFGLITCFDPFETGWDDTPRLDRGPIVATDMSAYVLMQMRTVSRFAEALGDAEKARHWKDRADGFADTLVRVCWNATSGRFHDVLLEDGSHLDILSPAPFLPFLGDVPIPLDDQRRAVNKHLLDASRMYSDIPFPCVSYDDPAYDPQTMWRGPMWPPISWLLLELLEKLELRAERKAAAKTLYEIVLKDGQLYEYFDSQTGRGLGFPQQGWTAALFLRLHVDLRIQDN